MATIKLEIVTPDRGEVLGKDIDMLIVRSTAGELGILPKHANLLTELLPHAMRIKVGGTEELVAIGGGFMEVTPDKITVLADAAELPDLIDVERAKAAQQRAEERIAAYKNSPKDSNIDIKRAESALARAKARLLVKNFKS
ncbi:MAG: F0F1 ATP synthase subunit epsilon [Selenomonadaceae bacterium]|nr:F0F1 ATP synthase subunit epsilon [Selenomonadaceae bacterium]